MLSFNLLPWREREKMARAKRVKQLILLCAFIQLGFFLGLYLLFNHQIIKLTHLKNRLSITTQQDDRDTIKNHRGPSQAMVAELRPLSKRTQQAWQLLASLSKAHDVAVCFQQLSQNDDEFTLIGSAASWLTLNRYLKAIRQQKFFHCVTTERLKSQPITSYIAYPSPVQFKLVIDLTCRAP